MRVFRTEMIANSAATNHPFARTSASTASKRMLTSRTGLSMDWNLRTDSSRLVVRGWWWAGSLTFPTAEEVRVDELVDGRLIVGLHLVELQAHAVAAIAPRNAGFRCDVAFRRWQPEPETPFGAVLERTRRADGDTTPAQVERQRGRNGVTEPIRDGDAEHNARAAAAVEIVGK